MPGSSDSEVPHFGDLILRCDSEDSLVEDAFDLVEKVRKDWSREDFKTKPFKDGITNQLIGVYSSAGDKNDMVLIRVYGNNTDQIIDRNAEIRNMKLFHEHGCGPVIYATFANGLVYSFIPGDILTMETVVDEEISQGVIEMLVKMHKMETGAEKKPGLWDRLRNFCNLGPDGFPDDEVKAKRIAECKIPSKAKLKQEIDDLEAALSNCDSPLVFSHNDLLLANAIVDKKTKKVTFIDYEYGDYNYQAFDIANHFNEFPGVVEVLDYDKYYPREDFQKHWLRRYLQKWHNQSEGQISEQEVHSFYVLVNQFSLASHLMWGLWALVQAKFSAIDFDFIDYAMQRLNEYFRRKEERLAMK